MSPLMRTPLILFVSLVLGFGAGGSAVARPAVPAWRLETPWTTETATVVVGDERIDAEVADTADLRSRGLGYRDGLEPGTGMLFVYKAPGSRSFWMKGMRFCLDIVWIDGNRIVGAAENACPEPGVRDVALARYVSPEPVTYVLELPAGWLADHGYGRGTTVWIALPGDATDARSA